jgi:ATP-binding cassette subfamily B protein
VLERPVVRAPDPSTDWGADLSVGAVWQRGFRYLRPYRGRVALALVLVTVWTALGLAGPYLISVAIDDGIARGSARTLNLAIASYVAVKIIAYFVQRAEIVVVSQVGEGYLRDLRVRVFDHLQRMSLGFLDRYRSGVLVSRMTSDVDSLQELVQTGLSTLLSNTLLLVLSVSVLGIKSWKLLAVCLVAVPFVVLASVRFQRLSSEAYLAVRDRIAQTLAHLQEGIAGVRVVQAFAREGLEADRFAQEGRLLYGAHMHAVKQQAWYLPVIEFAGYGSTALVVGYGGVLVQRGEASIGDVTFFVLTLSNLFDPIQQFSQLFNQLQSAGASLRKLVGLLDTPPDVPERADAVVLPASGALAAEALSFRYVPGADLVLREVDLVVTKGERLALVGPTGAGKSTLAKLFARLYDPTGGRVSFAGVDLRRATLASLRARIVVVPQEGFLFNATLRDNVRLARPAATDAEVERALAEIGCLDRFRALEDGLDTRVQERGSRLSAGEKQLVSLARAALVDPAVLVLDEATSSLDPGTEVLVENAVQRLMRGRTVIVIAHRLTTAERADRVAMIDEGRLVEVGTHCELLVRAGPYAALHASWRGGIAPR